MITTGRGDRRGQQRRRRKNNKNTPRLDNDYMLIDGNYSCRPTAYCSYYQGFLTNNQVQLHQCDKKGCTRLRSLEWKFAREGDT